MGYEQCLQQCASFLFANFPRSSTAFTGASHQSLDAKLRLAFEFHAQILRDLEIFQAFEWHPQLGHRESSLRSHWHVEALPMLVNEAYSISAKS